MTYARLVRPLLFRFDPESVHRLTLRALALTAATRPGRAWLRRACTYSDAALRVSAFGLDFANPVGLAAGYDKDGIAVAGLGLLGFGHVEIGTLTRRPQDGNARPRVFRLTEDQALINRMGFPNRGLAALDPAALGQARRRCPQLRIGLNLGKGKDTPNDSAADDYLALLADAYPHADYIALNVSSPNTPGLRDLQAEAALAALLRQVIARRDELHASTGRRAPVLVKISPDMPVAELEAALQVIMELRVDGLIATNTTLGRAGLRSNRCSEIGGLSGAPLRERATEFIRHAYRRTDGRLPIIGVGGIDGAAAALEKIRAGATLVQLYTGLVYHGPGLVQSINRGLAAAVRGLGMKTVQDLVGAESVHG